MYIYPPLEKFSLLEFNSFEQIIETGYEFALKELIQFKENYLYIL